MQIPSSPPIQTLFRSLTDCWREGAGALCNNYWHTCGKDWRSCISSSFKLGFSTSISPIILLQASDTFSSREDCIRENHRVKLKFIDQISVNPLFQIVRALRRKSVVYKRCCSYRHRYGLNFWESASVRYARRDDELLRHGCDKLTSWALLTTRHLRFKVHW